MVETPRLQAEFLFAVGLTTLQDGSKYSISTQKIRDLPYLFPYNVVKK